MTLLEIKSIIEQRIQDNQTFTPIDQNGTNFNNEGLESYIRPYINISDSYGRISGFGKVNINGFLIISVLTLHDSRTCENRAWNYGDEIFNLFNFHEYPNTNLRHTEAVLNNIGQIDNKWYQVNININQSYHCF